MLEFEMGSILQLYQSVRERSASGTLDTALITATVEELKRHINALNHLLTIRQVSLLPPASRKAEGRP